MRAPFLALSFCYVRFAPRVDLSDVSSRYVNFAICFGFSGLCGLASCGSGRSFANSGPRQHSLFITGSISKGTAVKDALEHDVVVVMRCFADCLQAANDIDKRLRETDSESNIVVAHVAKTGCVVLANYKGFELAIIPKPETFMPASDP